MKIVGVTSCPTGIAHTYMAQEALEKAARKMGHICHIETQGSIGIESELKKQEIEEADVVLLACGVSCEGARRFKGKRIIKKEISECVGHPKRVIEEVENELNS